jgi:hypothetical protein
VKQRFNKFHKPEYDNTWILDKLQSPTEKENLHKRSSSTIDERSRKPDPALKRKEGL